MVLSSAATPSSLASGVTASEDDERWHAVQRRGQGVAGGFFYAVLTTGVYCRPSCAARTPRRENVVFFAAPAEAERAGYRACKRCRPNSETRERRQALLIAEVCRRIEQCEPAPGLDELARDAGLSPSHLHRVFKAVLGLTPKAYALARRAERLRTELHEQTSVTQAIYGAGYGSSSRFYESSQELLGMTPTLYRSGGPALDIRFAIGSSSLGLVLVGATPRGVCAILLGDERQALLDELAQRFPHASRRPAGAEFEHWVAQVVNWVENSRAGSELPLDIQGTAFQQRVWQALRSVAPGETVSYSELARAVGLPAGARAVAQACAANPLAVAIPCHRAVRKDGSLSGYRWGRHRKREMLKRESEAAAQADDARKGD